VDAYPQFTKADGAWLVALLESKVAYPDDISAVRRRKAGLDLELSFKVAQRSRGVFTEAVCLEITAQVAERTGAIGPVVYVEGDPHPAAKEALDYAARGA
jgi:hypothetical protein